MATTETSVEITKKGVIYSDFLTTESVKQLLKEFVLKTEEENIAFYKMNEGCVNFQNEDVIISFGINFYPTKHLCSIKNLLSSMNFDETKNLIREKMNL